MQDKGILDTVKNLPEDVQSSEDHRNVYIDQVGICDVKIPATVGGIEKNPETTQHVQVTGEFGVSLRPEWKGIHMSRLIEDWIAMNQRLDINTVFQLLDRMAKRQDADQAHVKLDFDYFLDRAAPVSGKNAPQAYGISFIGDYHQGNYTLVQQLRVLVATLCPCSKAISEYGAHNQRGLVEVNLIHTNMSEAKKVDLPLEDIIGKLETAASSPLFPLLKRVDERFVTMKAYEEPRFVEDLSRNVAVALQGDPRYDHFKVRVTNYESIHMHNAYAELSQ